jgi:hypothetical protein
MGTVVLAGAPVVAGMGASPAVADEEEGIGFFFAGRDSAVDDPTDIVVMQGCGHFDESSGNISGNGFFVNFEQSSTVFPNPIKATGFWNARELESFDKVHAFGVQLTGIMVAKVELFRQSPEREAVIPALLTVVCNIPAIPFLTGMEEGFQLVFGGHTFVPGTPTIGISGFDDLRLREGD